MTDRWPLHPAPTAGEALTSWLRRIAEALHVNGDTLMHDLGYHLPDRGDLDLAPPDGFIERLTKRTGVPTDRIRAMSLIGYCPWLIDDLAPTPGGYTIYTRQMSILLPHGSRLDRDLPTWRAWFSATQARRARACPSCGPDHPPPQPYQLLWSIPLMLTCPFHHCLLQPYDGFPWWHLFPSGELREPVPASTAVQTMDQWTWQALTSGQVDLPRRRVHAGIWFRLLRTLLDELGATFAECGTARVLSQRVWDEAGHRPRAGQNRWRAYEDLPPAAQDETLDAAAAAIQALRLGMITGRGTDAALFLPEPHVPVDAGQPGRRPPQHDEPTVGETWRRFHDSLAQCVSIARRDPQSARQLFAMVTYSSHHNPDDQAKMRATFAELGIPLDFLSQ